jgi:hypothetical protein
MTAGTIVLVLMELIFVNSILGTTIGLCKISIPLGITPNAKHTPNTAVPRMLQEMFYRQILTLGGISRSNRNFKKQPIKLD